MLVGDNNGGYPKGPGGKRNSCDSGDSGGDGGGNNRYFAFAEWNIFCKTKNSNGRIDKESDKRITALAC